LQYWLGRFAGTHLYSGWKSLLEQWQVFTEDIGVL